MRWWEYALQKPSKEFNKSEEGGGMAQCSNTRTHNHSLEIIQIGIKQVLYKIHFFQHTGTVISAIIKCPY